MAQTGSSIPFDSIVNSWIDTGHLRTFTGRTVKPLHLAPTDIDIVDIAHALSHLCRFCGHCRKFYSVAEHSVRVAWIAPQSVALWALLHDSAEAYLVDFPLALKGSPGLGELYKLAEQRAMRQICQRFGLPLEEPPVVKQCDRILLATEFRDLMAPGVECARLSHPRALTDRIRPWTAVKARQEFLRLFQALS